MVLSMAVHRICAWLLLLLRVLLFIDLSHPAPDDIQHLVIQPAAGLRVIGSIILGLLVLQNVQVGDVWEASWKERFVVGWPIGNALACVCTAPHCAQDTLMSAHVFCNIFFGASDAARRSNCRS